MTTGDPPRQLGARMRYLAAIDGAAADRPARLCDGCVQALPIQRAAIALHVDGAGLEILCASDAIAERVEWEQITLGEGPGWDAVAGSGPVTADLSVDSRRWPVFAAAAARDGVGMMYALPLQVGAIRVGVLDLYCDDVVALGAEDFADAVAIADLVSAILLTVARAGRLSESLSPWWDQPLSTRAVHQATGMVMVQLGISARDAYVRLQAFAYVNDRLINEVAADVVDRRLRFDSDSA